MAECPCCGPPWGLLLPRDMINECGCASADSPAGYTVTIDCETYMAGTYNLCHTGTNADSVCNWESNDIRYIWSRSGGESRPMPFTIALSRSGSSGTLTINNAGPIITYDVSYPADASASIICTRSTSTPKLDSNGLPTNTSASFMANWHYERTNEQVHDDIVAALFEHRWRYLSGWQAVTTGESTSTSKWTPTGSGSADDIISIGEWSGWDTYDDDGMPETVTLTPTCRNRDTCFTDWYSSTGGTACTDKQSRSTCGTCDWSTEMVFGRRQFTQKPGVSTIDGGDTVFNSSATYALNEAVRHSGVWYFSKVSSNSGNTPTGQTDTNWTAYLGLWDSGTSYVTGDVVRYTFSGASWPVYRVANTANTNHDPETYSSEWDATWTGQDWETYWVQNNWGQCTGSCGEMTPRLQDQYSLFTFTPGQTLSSYFNCWQINDL